MLLAAHYQTIDVSNLVIQPYTTDKKGRVIAPLQYKQHGLLMQGCTVLTPPLQIHSYDSSMNRLQLNLTDQRSFANKILAIQEFLGQSDLPLHKLCSHTTLTVYVFPSSPVQGASSLKSISEMKPGDTLRLLIRFHHLQRLEDKAGLRLQHSIPVIYQISE
jgi:hypothetical protein